MTPDITAEFVWSRIPKLPLLLSRPRFGMRDQTNSAVMSGVMLTPPPECSA